MQVKCIDEKSLVVKTYGQPDFNLTTCTVTPTNGIALETQFSFTCQNEYNDTKNNTLRYSFLHNDIFITQYIPLSSNTWNLFSIYSFIILLI